MDAMYAMLSYDHHRDNGLQELKIPQSRTGLGDEIMQASFMCDEWNSQSEGDCTCAPKSPSSTTSLSWPGSPQRSVSCKKVELLELAIIAPSADIEPPPPYFDSINDCPPQYVLGDIQMGVSLNNITSAYPPRIVEPISKALDALIRTMCAPRIDTSDSSHFRQAKKKSKTQKGSWDDKGAGGGEENGGGGSNNADGGAGDGGTGDGVGGGAGDGGAGDGGAGDGGGGGGGGGGDDDDSWETGGGGKKKKGKKAKNNKNEVEEKTEKEENDGDEDKGDNDGKEKDEEKSEMFTPWDYGPSPTQKKKKSKGKGAAGETKSKKNDDEKNENWFGKDDGTKQEDEKEEKVETEPAEEPWSPTIKKKKKGKRNNFADEWTDQGQVEAADNGQGMNDGKQETEKGDREKEEESQEPVPSWEESGSSYKGKKAKAKSFGLGLIDEDEATKNDETEATTNEDHLPTEKDENQMQNTSESPLAKTGENASPSNAKKKKSKKGKLNPVGEELPEKKDGQPAPKQEEAELVDKEDENKDATYELGVPTISRKKKVKKNKATVAEEEEPPKRDDNQEEGHEKTEKAEDELNIGDWDSPNSKKSNKKAKSSVFEEEERKKKDGEENDAKEDAQAPVDTFDEWLKPDTKKKPNKKGRPIVNEEETQNKDAGEEVKEDTWTMGDSFDQRSKIETKKTTNKKGKPIVNGEETQKKDTQEKEAKKDAWNQWPKNEKDDGKKNTSKKGKLDVDEDEEKKKKDDKDRTKIAFSWDDDGEKWEESFTKVKADAPNDLATSSGPMYGVNLDSMDLGLSDTPQNFDLNQFANWGKKWDTDTHGRGDMNTLGTDTTKVSSTKTTSGWSFSALENPEETSTSFGIANSWGTDNFLTSGTQEKPSKKQGLFDFGYDNKSKEVEHDTILEDTLDSNSWGVNPPNKKKNKKGDVEPSPQPTASIPEEESSVTAGKKKKPKKASKDLEPAVQEEVPKFGLAVDASFGGLNTQKGSKEAKKDTKTEDEKANDPVTNMENFGAGGLGDNEYGAFWVAKKDKESPKGFDKSDDWAAPTATESRVTKVPKKEKKKKKDSSLDFDGPVIISSKLEPKNESETKPEEDEFSWTFENDKKTSKDVSTEANKFDFLDVGSVGVEVPSFGKTNKKVNKTDLDAATQGDGLDFFSTTKSVAEFDGFSSSWMNGTKKTQKGTSEVKGSEAEIPITKESTEVNDTATTEVQAKKEKGKKAKKTKAATDNAVAIPETVMEKRADFEESGWDDWGSPSQGRKNDELDEQEKEDKKTKSGKKGKSKNKELLAGSTPDEISIGSDVWSPWDNPKKSLISAPPPAPTPPRQGLSPEPTTSSISGLNGTGDDYWASTPYQPPSSKSKKDVKQDNSKWATKGWNDQTEDLNEESLKDSVKEGTPADTVGSFWGLGSKATKSKASREKEKAEAAKKEEEDANLMYLEDSTNAGFGAWKLDPIDESAVTKSSKSKETNISKATSQNSKESDKASKISDNYKGWNTDRIDESVVTKGSKSKESNVSKATSKKPKENSENYKAWDNDAVDESVVTKGSKSKDSNVSKIAGKNSKETDKDKKKKKASAKTDYEVAEEVLPVPVSPVSPVILDGSKDGYNQASEEASKDDGGNNDDGKADLWNFWGAKKTIGTNKKNDGPKKEIANSAMAEPTEALKDWSNTPEPSFLDDKPEPQKISEIKTSRKAMSKPTGKSAVLQRVKALEATRIEKEKEKEKAEREKAVDPLPSPVVAPFEPLDKVESPPKKFGKSKAIPGNKGAASKKKDLSPPPVEERQASKDSIPGSFPAETLDDDLFIDVLDPPVKENKSKESSKLSKLSKLSKESSKYKEEPVEEPECDILVDVVETPSKKKSNKDSSKLNKANKKPSKSKKEPKMEPLIDFDTSTPPELPDVQDEPDEPDEPEEPGDLEVPEVPEAPKAPEAPPTPPPEPVSAKPAKKERAKVVRDEGGSWAFWAASPRKPAKKELKAKDDAVPSPAAKERAPSIGLTRSKSMKTAKEKETEKTSAKSSGSDKDKKPEARIARPRPSAFGGFFGGLPPPRAKPVRKPSAATPKSFSRRGSIEVDAIDIPSPPAEEAPEMNNKAARLMGTAASKIERKDSIRTKPKGRRQYLHPRSTKYEQEADFANVVVPDPYPIDDDDMILVNDLEDPVINPPISKTKDIRREKSTSTRAKKEVHSNPNSPTGSPKLSPEADISWKNEQVNPVTEPTDDTIMLEAGPSSDGAELPSLQEALAFDEKPRSSPVVQRPLANTKKSDSKLMGLFGGFRKPRRASEMYERPRKVPVDEFDGTLRRKRGVAGDGDAPKRIRREDRKARRSEKTDAEDDGFITEAPIFAESPVPDSHDFRRDEPRAKRPSRSQPSKERKRSRVRDTEDQRLKRQEVDQAEDGLRRAKARERRERKEQEETDIRRAERRAKRAARDERSKDGPNSREGDEADIRREEKRLKRVAREEKPIKEEPQFRDFDPIPTPERRSKRREKDPQDRDKRRESSSRPRKPDRRRTNIDSPRSPGTPSRRPTLERHRSSRRPTGEKDKSHSNRRSSAQPPVDSYFDSRNGAGGEATLNDAIHPPPILDPLQQDPPYIHSGGNDHTSSWVKSQISEPPPPPPVEPSVLDPPPVLGPSGLGGDDSAGEEARRALRRKSRRQSRAYGEPDPEVETPRRRHRESSRKGIKSSEGSAEQERDRWRRKSEYGAVMSPASGRSPMLGSGLGGGAKRGSWFKKFKDIADGR